MKSINTKDITVGITTRFGNKSIIKTIQSIRDCIGGSSVSIIVINGGGHYLASDQKQLKKLKVKVVDQTEQGTIPQKVKKLIKNTKSKLLIITQDDILFSKNLLIEIQKAFLSNQNKSMIMPGAKFSKSENAFQKAIEVGRNISNTVIDVWRNGDNFISVNGRCMSFPLSYVKKFRLPENVISFDTFMYLENQRLGGKVVRVNNSYVVLKPPANYKDHSRQSSRYLGTKKELLKLFPKLNPNYFEIPLHILLYASLLNAIKSPYYFVIYIYIKIKSKIDSGYIKLSPTWSVDESTKL